MWTILNQSSASISVSDIPIPQTLLPNTSGQFLVRDVMTSNTLQANLANGALVVTQMGTFGPSEEWLPVQYPVYNGTISQNGQSNIFTMEPFTNGELYVNVTAISGTLTLSYQQYDGTTFYPATALVTITTTGAQAPVSVAWLGFAGRVTWTISASGSATIMATLDVK